MSKFHSLKTQFKDRDALIDSLVEMGYAREHIEIHETAKQLYGFQGDLRSERANVIVRRQFVGRASNDIGWELQADGTYAQHISDFDKGRHDGKWCNGLKRGYTEATTIKTAAKNGFKYLGKTTENGKIQLKFL